MSWDKIAAITDLIILAVLLCWMTMDRCNFYFIDKE